MESIINTKLGTHRGKRRIWIEGMKLLNGGYQAGQRFNIESDESTLKIIPDREGKYTVSRRLRNGKTLPIIDISVDIIAKMFEGIECLTIRICEKVIEITGEYQQRQIVKRESKVLEKLKNGFPLSSFCLFHGGGILSSAIHSGFLKAKLSTYVKYVNDQKSAFLESSLANNVELFKSDTVIIDSPIELIQRHNLRDVDFVIAGIPCVGASRSGRSKNKINCAEEHVKAGDLFYYFLDIVRTVNPAFIIIENVYEYSRSVSMLVIRSVLSKLGYVVHETKIEGNAMGALENRVRLGCIAVSRGLDNLDLNEIKPLREKESSLKDVLEYVALDSLRWKDCDYLAKKEIKDRNDGKQFRRQILTGNEASVGVAGFGYSKYRSTEPMIKHPTSDKVRLYTTIENCKVKTVPEKIVHGLSNTAATEVLGQGVIYTAFESLAYYLGLRLNSLINTIELA